MATLTDKYVNALVAANDAKTAERKANIQAQYNAWAKKQNALATPEMQPVEMQTIETQEIPSLKPVEYPSQINQLVQTVNQQRKKNEEKKNGNEVVMDENGIADIDSVKRNARATTSQRQADAAKKKAEKAKSTDVVMDENGVVDVDSVKRNARATTPQRQADWANAQLAKGNYPQAQYTADGKLDVAALQNDPRIQQMQTRALNDKGVVHEETNATKLINERANTLLDPAYKMTKDDKANFDKLVEQWRKENPQAAYEWDNNFDGEVYHWDFLDKYPEIRTIMDVEQKYDPFASFANGLRGSFDFPQLVGAQIGKLFSDEEGDKKIEEDLARRQQQIANARTQHGIASGLGGFYGLAMQNNVISDAAKALGLFGEAVNGGSKLVPFLQEQAVQLGADALTQTAPIVARDIYENKDAGTVAKDALADLGTNALFNLGLGGAEIGLNALGARKAAKQALNSVPVNQADDIAEQAAKSAPIDDVVKAVDDVPARNAVEEAIDTAKKALNDVPAKQVIDEAQNVKEVVRESAESIFHRNPVTEELSTNGKALMRRMNEIGNEVNGNENAMKVWLDYVDELEKADAGQENVFRAVSDELSNAIGTNTARKNIEEAYDLVINNEVPKTFSGSQVDELNPLFKLMDETALDDVKYAPVEVRNSIEDVLYKNMDAIQKNETLKNKVVEVEEAYDKWVEAIYSGVGDTNRLGKDVQNAVNRLNTSLKKEGMDQVKVNWQTYTRPDYLMNQVKPEGYVAPTAKSVAESVEPEAKLTIEPTKAETAKVSPINPEEAETLERSYARNIREGRVDASEEVKQAFENEPRTYQRISNKATSESVDEIMKQGEDFAREQYELMKGTNDARFAPLGQRIARQLSDAGKHNEAAAVLDEVAEELTKAGQMTQAAYITMLKDDPLTALASVQKQIKKLNTEGIEKYGKKWKTFALTDDEIKAFGDLKKGDEEGLKEVIDGISSRLGSEQYTSVMDKLLEARKIAMLLNPRTNVRNVVANVPTLGMRWLSDRVAAVGERAYKALVDPNYQLTQGLTGSGENGRNIAKRIYNGEYVQNLIKGTPGKYEVPELKNALIDNKTMYKGTAVDRFLESAGVDIQGLNKKLFGKDNVHSLAETTRNLNYKLLDLGDSPFVRENFIERLGSYVNAQGITSATDIPKEAIDLAWQEAMKATYKDNSWAVQMISGLKKGIEKVPGIGRPVSQAVIPFVQAPGNIAARMVDYSAVGGANGLKNIIKGTKGGDAKLVREGIDQLSKGLTGTGLVVAGIALHNAGIITGPFSKDKDQRNFQKQSGYREYALHIGDKYYTYDWAQPAAQNLILGTLLAEAINNSDQYDSTVLRSMGIENSTAGKVIGSMKEGAKASVNAWFNESPMQGLAELMKGTAGSYDTDIASNLWNVAASDFASSFIPSVVNASAKTSDTTQRQTTDYDNTFTSFINQQKAKIPGLSETLPAKYDTWGREMKNGETVGEAAFARFFNPGDLATDKHDRLDEEINKLYEATKDVNVFPTTAPTSANGEKLSAKEYSDYQKDMGQRSHDMVQSLIDSDLYKSMSNEEKVKTLSGIYSASKALTENKLYKKEIKNNAVANAYLEGGAKGVVKYYATKQALDKYGISDSSKAGEAVADSRHPEKTAKELNEITHDLKRVGLLDKEKKQPPSEIVDIYEESGMRGVNDYVSVETNSKGGSYSGYQSMKKTIPYLTAKEYMDIYNTYSVPNKNGVYDNTFSQEEELIPYLTSRTWDNDKQLNQVAHILGPSSKGTWHIDSNNNLYYNKPSVEPWGVIENENVLNMVNLLKEK